MDATLTTPHTLADSHQQDALEQTCQQLARKDFCLLPAALTRSLLLQQSPAALADWETFQNSWSSLQQDKYMADGGRYRKRLHATLSAGAASRQARVGPHQPHYQSLDYNALNGGIARHYEPIHNAVLNGNTMQNLLQLACTVFGKLSPYTPWHIEAHQFRIEALNREQGKPTPEGIHRDGVNFILMMMVKRRNLVNGATTIYDLARQPLAEFTLTEPLDLALVNDERVFHGVTPIVQLDSDREATRDVLVITFRRQS